MSLRAGPFKDRVLYLFSNRVGMRGSPFLGLYRLSGASPRPDAVHPRLGTAPTNGVLEASLLNHPSTSLPLLSIFLHHAPGASHRPPVIRQYTKRDNTQPTMTMLTRPAAAAAAGSPVPETDLKTVVESRNREWHFHIYFLTQSPVETAAALALRDAVLRLRRDGKGLRSVY